MPYLKRICSSCGLDYRPERSSQGRCENCIAAERWIKKHRGFLHALPIGFAILLVVVAFGPGARAMLLRDRSEHPPHEPPAHTQSIPVINDLALAKVTSMTVSVKETADPPPIHIDTYKVVNPPKPKVHKVTAAKSYATDIPAVKPHTAVSSSSKVQSVLAYARAQIGESYVLGGAGPSVWDCSGLTLMAFRNVGVSIGTHSATNQYLTAKSRGLLVPYADKRPGDLIFYSSGVDMYHVTIYSGNGKMIEAPNPTARVRERTIWGTPYAYVARFL